MERVKPLDEGDFMTLTNSQVLEITSMLEEQEQNDKIDNDYLIELLKTIKKYRRVFSEESFVRQVAFTNQYIQILLDIIFYALSQKYNYIWVHDQHLTNLLTASQDVLNFFKDEQKMSALLEQIRNFKKDFSLEFNGAYEAIEDTIERPDTQDEIFVGIENIKEPQTETRNRFLNYYKNTAKQREQKKQQFVDELINALVFQYIFGVSVLGKNFMEFSENLSSEESYITYPFDMKNSFLFGWAAKSVQPQVNGISINSIEKLPEVLLKLDNYKSKVAKNAALNIIRCQFSAWTMKMNEEFTRLRRNSLKVIGDTIRWFETIKQPMEIEVEEEEKENPDYDKEYINEFMKWTKGGKLSTKYQYYDYESRTKRTDEMKPTNAFTLEILQRNLLKKTKQIFEQIMKRPVKKDANVLQEKE